MAALTHGSTDLSFVIGNWLSVIGPPVNPKVPSTPADNRYVAKPATECAKLQIRARLALRRALFWNLPFDDYCRAYRITPALGTVNCQTSLLDPLFRHRTAKSHPV